MIPLQSLSKKIKALLNISSVKNIVLSTAPFTNSSYSITLLLLASIFLKIVSTSSFKFIFCEKCCDKYDDYSPILADNDDDSSHLGAGSTSFDDHSSSGSTITPNPPPASNTSSDSAYSSNVPTPSEPSYAANPDNTDLNCENSFVNS